MKRIVLWLTLLAASCATQTRHPVSGPPLTAVTEEESKALLNDLRLDLRDVSLEQIGGKSLDADVIRGQVQADLAADAVFERGNAQVRAEALKPLAEIAQAVAARGGCVAHVIGFSKVDDDLIERRAASIADDFARRGIPGSRLRFESRIDEAGDDRIAIVLKPVIIGRESAAWIAPALGE